MRHWALLALLAAAPGAHAGVRPDGLPIVEVDTAPAKGVFAVLYSGDGGWAGIDKAMAAELARQGVPVAGINSLRYFWRARTPEECARDLERILAHYSEKWGAREAVLVGFSFGADVLPTIVNRLPPGWKPRLRSVSLLAPSPNSDFEFHVSDWLKSSARPTSIPLIPEIERLGLPRVLCVYGLDEADEVCTRARGVRPLGLPGGHHFNGDAAAIIKAVLEPDPAKQP